MPFCDVCNKYIERPRTYIKDGYEYKVCLQCLLELRREEKGGGYPTHGRTGRQKCKCPTCKGTGKETVWSVAGIPITERTCSECNGRKWVWC